MDCPKDVEYPRSLNQVTELGQKGAESQVAGLTSSNAWKAFVQISLSAQKVNFLGVSELLFPHSSWEINIFSKVKKGKIKKKLCLKFHVENS